VDLYVTEAGEGAPVLLLHGLTATHRYVVMGSKALERGGHRVIAYDARGHGASDPAPSPDAYRYEDLRDDLVRVMDEHGVERAVLAGASMGAHTILRLALEQPDRVAGLVVITPAYDPEEFGDADSLARWDALAAGLREGGVEGFVEAYGDPPTDPKWAETFDRVRRQRMAAHEHPEAVADALAAVPRSRPFEAWEDLAEVRVPAIVVASRDEPDPEHPYATAERWAEAIPGAELRSEEPGSSPLAWQGGQLSRVIGETADRATTDQTTR
jgi:pimeloyl-ACP methyl ester carboxylesterase